MLAEQDKKKSPSWGVIIFLCIIFWPVGLFLLIKRITSDKTSALHNSNVLNVIGWIFVVIGISYIIMAATGQAAVEDGESVVGGVVVSIVFFGFGGGAMIHQAKRMKGNAIKYKKYISMVVNNNITTIENIAASIPTTYDEAVKDLEKMIEIGYFQGAYIDKNNHEIVMSKKQSEDKVPNENIEEAEEVEKTKAIICSSCGANNTIVIGNVCECEYCGSPL